MEKYHTGSHKDLDAFGQCDWHRFTLVVWPDLEIFNQFD